MKFYKSKENEVFAYEDDGSQDEFIVKDLVKITKKEADELREVVLSTLPTLSIQAQHELDLVTGSRGTVIRCLISDVQIPTEWVDYIKSLRLIVNGDDKTSVTLPKKPSYPEGT